MAAPSPVVLLVAPPGAAVPDVSGPLADAGFAVHAFGGEPHPSPSAAVLLADAIADPTAFTRRLRVDLDPRIPILWLLTKPFGDLAQFGLDAGADACLLRPVSGPLLVAQLRALLRSADRLGRLSAGADELRGLTDRLQRLFRQGEQDADLARRLTRGMTVDAIPNVGPWRFGVANRAGGLETVVLRAGTAVVIVETGGVGSVGGAVVSGAVSRALCRAAVDASPPAEAMTRVGRQLHAAGLPDSAVVSAAVAVFETDSAKVRLATAGFPAPVQVHVNAAAVVWSGSGVFLGATDSGYTELSGTLMPGEKLLLLGAGLADRRPDIRAAADLRRAVPAQPLADAVANELGTEAELTLVVAELGAG